MANYAVDDYEFGPDSLANVLAAIEAKLETIDNTKTIRLLEVYHVYGDKFRGALIVDS